LIAIRTDISAARAGFSLSRALFRKNVGAPPNIWIPPDWIHTTRSDVS